MALILSLTIGSCICVFWQLYFNSLLLLKQVKTTHVDKFLDSFIGLSIWSYTLWTTTFVLHPDLHPINKHKQRFTFPVCENLLSLGSSYCQLQLLSLSQLTPSLWLFPISAPTLATICKAYQVIYRFLIAFVNGHNDVAFWHKPSKPISTSFWDYLIFTSPPITYIQAFFWHSHNAICIQSLIPFASLRGCWVFNLDSFSASAPLLKPSQFLQSLQSLTQNLRHLANLSCQYLQCRTCLHLVGPLRPLLLLLSLAPLATLKLQMKALPVSQGKYFRRTFWHWRYHLNTSSDVCLSCT
jgi:hypothetical protein